MKVPEKTHQIGFSTVVIHSPLVAMSSEERKEYFEKERSAGNRVLKEIAFAVNACYRN